jgi:hypothetical protein
MLKFGTLTILGWPNIISQLSFPLKTPPHLLMPPNIPSHLVPSEDSNLSFPGFFKLDFSFLLGLFTTPPSWASADPVANTSWYRTYAKSMKPFSLYTLLSPTLTLSSLLSLLKHNSLLY